MDNPDVLFEITTKLDNQTLERLATTPAWTAISALIDNRWWYVRSERLVGETLRARPGVDWKRIYYSLLASHLHPEELQIVHGLDYLPSLLTLIEVYGEPDLASIQVERRLWMSVESKEALDYLVDELFLDGSLELSFASLQAAIDNDRVQMIKPMLYWIKLGEDEQGWGKKAVHRRLEEIMLRVIENQQVAMLEVFVDERIAPGSASALNAAIKTRRLDIVRLMLSNWYPQQTLAGAARIAVEMDWSEGLTLFLGKIDENNWQGLFYNALGRGSGHAAEMLISKRLATDLDEQGWKHVLHVALASENRSMIDYALVRISPESEIGLYDALVRLIFTKDPSSLELTEWMEERDDPMIEVATQLVLGHHATVDPELVPIRALLLCMLYPTLTPWELADGMQQEGISEQDVLRAMILVRAHRSNGRPL